MRKSRPFRLHSDNNWVSFESERMHALLCMSNRLCERTTAAYHLVNELQMWWNKGRITSPKFQTVCERSRYLLASKTCAYEIFECKQRRSVAPACKKDVCDLVNLLEKGALYPLSSEAKRVFNQDFWWDFVRPKIGKIGSTVALANQAVPEESHTKSLFEVMTAHKSERCGDDFVMGEVHEEEDDDALALSSTIGSVASQCDNY